MKVTGTRGHITFDMENGYVAEAEGELTFTPRFYVRTDSLKYWNPPHGNERITPEQIEMIKREVARNNGHYSVPIVFD